MEQLLVKDIVKCIESFASPGLQEAYDNSGLQAGELGWSCTGVLISLDVTPEVIDEAIASGCNLVISHHPLTLTGVKRITGDTMAVKVLVKAIKHDVAIYSAHTNYDVVQNGVSGLLATKLGILNQTVLEPKIDALFKLITYVPEDNLQQVRLAIFNAGAGHIGNYDSCSFSIAGNGTFRGGADTNPFIGKSGVFQATPEIRFETIMPGHLKHQVITALREAHPYEEPAYDVIPLANEWAGVGLGIIGRLPVPMIGVEFLEFLKSVTSAGCIRYSGRDDVLISKVAVCGGSGGSLMGIARQKGADAFVTADLKYHQFFDGNRGMLIADPGHYESEQFIKELFLTIITKKYPNFAVRISELKNNPIKYLI